MAKHHSEGGDIGFFVLIVVVALIFIIVKAARSARGSSLAAASFDQQLDRGRPARAIFLQVAPRGVWTGAQGRRFQSRMCTVDVEIPGERPYEVSTNVIIPQNLVRDVLPGATLEVRVSRTNSAQITVVGPGAGFSPMAMLAQISTPPGNS